MLCTSVSAVLSPSAAVSAAFLLTSSGFISYTERITDVFNKQQSETHEDFFSEYDKLHAGSLFLFHHSVKPV